MKAHLIEEIEKMATEITEDISNRLDSLKKEFGPEEWAELNHSWGEMNREIDSKKTEIPNWTVDEMLKKDW